jgi:hypothetical protein
MRFPLMNNTKWSELRLAMDGMDPSPRWITLSDNGHLSSPDRDWYYHFSVGGYKDTVYVDILTDTREQRDQVRSALKRIHLPGEETELGFRVYGYAQAGQVIDYI